MLRPSVNTCNHTTPPSFREDSFFRAYPSVLLHRVLQTMRSSLHMSGDNKSDLYCASIKCCVVLQAFEALGSSFGLLPDVPLKGCRDILWSCQRRLPSSRIVRSCSQQNSVNSTQTTGLLSSIYILTFVSPHHSYTPTAYSETT